MELKDLFARPEALQILATFAAGVLILAWGLFFGATGLKLTAKQWKDFRFYWTAYYPTMRAQVDQRTDAIPSAADKAFDKILELDWNTLISNVLTKSLDMANARIVPPQETVNINLESKPMVERGATATTLTYTPPGTPDA